ncbi:hypothetical protein [Lentzea sp. NPDC060358]|uniref:hypothetical protein n=1 Tax=Lentzea sp. NPDC060358 TaxID=3347103 RepID=UPI003664C0E7
MKNSVKLAVVVAASVAGVAACSPTPAAQQSAAPTPTTAPSPVDVAAGATEVTETKSAAGGSVPSSQARPVIGSFGYGDLKLGMTRKKAMDANLLGPILHGGKPSDACTVHHIIGTTQTAWVSTKLGVSTIRFTPDMSSDGVGKGATEATLRAEYTNLTPGGPNYTWKADADGHQAASFVFRSSNGTVTEAFLTLKAQECHN